MAQLLERFGVGIRGNYGGNYFNPLLFFDVSFNPLLFFPHPGGRPLAVAPLVPRRTPIQPRPRLVWRFMVF